MRFVLALLFCVSAFADSSARVLNTAPIRFEQHSDGWIARGLNHSIAFGDRAILLQLGGRRVSLAFAGSNARARFEGSGTLAATNYFSGSGFASVPTFRRLQRKAVYPGIDVVYYGNGGELEYDLEISPGADPSRIRMRFSGADRVALNDRGEIVLSLGDGTIVQRTPVVYQRRASGEIVPVPASYRIDRRGEVRVELGAYNRAEKLVVDPALTYSAYLEGTSMDVPVAIAHDNNGNIYLAGNTWSTDFQQITSDTAYQPANAGTQDIWVMQVNPASSTVTYCTYLGGGAVETVKAMTVDANGVIYLTGSAVSANFPVSSGAFQSTITGGTHAFVTVLDPSQAGSAGLIYSTFIGGANNEEGDAIAVAKGKIYVTGFTTSDNYPTVNPVQSARVAGFDGFVSVFDPTQSGAASLVFSTFLGGSGGDYPHAIAVDGAGEIYVAGITYSTDFPSTPLSYQPFYIGDGDGFLTRINPSTSTMDYSTMLGGSFGDDVKRIVVEPGGHVALAGYTLSPDFPLSQGSYQSAWKGNGSAFLTILDLTATAPLVKGLVYSTYFGGTGGEVALDLRRDAAGRYLMGGYTYSLDLPVTGNAMNPSSSGAGADGFIAILDPNQPPYSPAQLFYSSYVTGPGLQAVVGVDVDASGTIYATGFATSNLFPNGAQNPDTTGKMSAFALAFTLP